MIASLFVWGTCLAMAVAVAVFYVVASEIKDTRENFRKRVDEEIALRAEMLWNHIKYMKGRLVYQLSEIDKEIILSGMKIEQLIDMSEIEKFYQLHEKYSSEFEISTLMKLIFGHLEIPSNSESCSKMAETQVKTTKDVINRLSKDEELIVNAGFVIHSAIMKHNDAKEYA